MNHYLNHVKFPKEQGSCSVEAHATLMNAAPVVMYCSERAGPRNIAGLVFHVARVNGNLDLEPYKSYTSRLDAMSDFATIIEQWTQS